MLGVALMCVGDSIRLKISVPCLLPSNMVIYSYAAAREAKP